MKLFFLFILCFLLVPTSAQFYGGYGPMYPPPMYPPMYGGYGGYPGYGGYYRRHNPVRGALHGALMGAMMGAMMGKK